MIMKFTVKLLLLKQAVKNLFNQKNEVLKKQKFLIFKCYKAICKHTYSFEPFDISFELIH